ncbi:ras and EF-hand domain-containing protein homolog [Branchiostoma floridae]|uniref:Ras and EF-hand domain-containing protein homolog n=1 Tax=Branchiostoma floridae TaxID=7739 RepID=A0A9J7KS78_BRAFL|nr:ras and EF-hand domain-containing protein homolog [Branchiostoma floridae]
MSSPRERMYKVVMVGDSVVGKTSFILRVCRDEFKPNLNPTIGVDSQVKTFDVDGDMVALQIWDTAGQERFRSIATSYFRRSDGVILLYDVTYEASFLNVRDWITAVEDGAGKKLPIVLCGNKTDLRPTAEKYGKKVISTEAGKKLAKAAGAIFFETSAKEGSNIQEAVLGLARWVSLRQEEDRESKALALQLTNQVEPAEKPSQCC